MINFNELNEVTVINSRTNYDLRYSAKSEKFNLSKVAYDRLNINENGFRLFTQNDQPVLQVVPNDDATLHSGREGSTKGLTFTARILAGMLDLENEDAHYTFNEQEHEGNTYITLDRIGEDTNDEEELESITASTEEVEEDVDVDQPETLDRF